MTRAPIFIVGCPRSGTTLLRNLLRSHPNLTFPRESHFIPPFYRAYGDPADDREAIELARRVLALLWIRRWGLDLAPEQFAGCRTFRDFVWSLFDAWAHHENKPRWGDKTPHYVKDIPTLARLFPECQVVHIYRDGRDVAASWLRSRLEPANLYVAATLWRDWVTAGRRAGAALDSRHYLEVRYEDLVGDVRGTMETICDFLGEPYCDEVLAFSALPQEPWMRALAASTTEVVPANVEKWKAQLSRSRRVLFTSVAGDLLKELGYDVPDRPRRISAAERFVWRGHDTAVWAGRRVWRMTRPASVRTSWEFVRARVIDRQRGGSASGG